MNRWNLLQPLGTISFYKNAPYGYNKYAMVPAKFYVPSKRVNFDIQSWNALKCYRKHLVGYPIGSSTQLNLFDFKCTRFVFVYVFCFDMTPGIISDLYGRVFILAAICL